ncbi:MAG: DUF559 domain-containing protein [Candidatus Hermodarchaeota archaeon]
MTNEISKPKKPCDLDDYESWHYWKILKRETKKEHDKLHKLYNEIEKCETIEQVAALVYLFKIFPTVRVEKWFWDKINQKRWRVDIIIDRIVIEIDGLHHRFNDEQFNKDEEKVTFLFKNGFYVLRRSNTWIRSNYKELPELILNFMYKNKSKL